MTSAGGKAEPRVFTSLEDVAQNFAPFWNLLAYQQVASGSLADAFSLTLKVSRRLDRVNQRLYNADVPLLRNHLNNPLRPLISLIFEDIADQAQLEVLQSCYVHTGSLKVVANDLDNILTESIPRFLAKEGTRTVGTDHAEGGFDRSLAKSVGSNSGKLHLLLGGIGSGEDDVPEALSAHHWPRVARSPHPLVLHRFSKSTPESGGAGAFRVGVDNQ